MDDADTLIIKADKTLPLGTDICTNKFLFTTNTWGQYSVKLATAIATRFNFKVSGILDNWLFFNNELYLVVNGRSNSFGTATLQTMIVRVQIVLPAGQVPVVSFTQLYLTFGTIDQIATLELFGFAFTLTNSTTPGVRIGQINTASYASFILPILVPEVTVGPTTSNLVRWNLYQQRADNHMHRPIYAVSSTAGLTSQIYRLTTTFTLLVDTSTSTLSNLNYFAYPLQVQRYHAMHVSPGSCAQTQSNFDYDHTKAVIINLRSNTIEKCFDIGFIGCGDGVFDPSAGQQCNDGNRMSADGCSQACKIETGFVCTTVVGQRSICTNIYCGNG